MVRVPKVPVTPGRENIILQRGTEQDARDTTAQHVLSIVDQHRRVGLPDDLVALKRGALAGVRQAMKRLESEAAEKGGT